MLAQHFAGRLNHQEVYVLLGSISNVNRYEARHVCPGGPKDLGCLVPFGLFDRKDVLVVAGYPTKRSQDESQLEVLSRETIPKTNKTDVFSDQGPHFLIRCGSSSDRVSLSELLGSRDYIFRRHQGCYQP